MWFRSGTGPPEVPPLPTYRTTFYFKQYHLQKLLSPFDSAAIAFLTHRVYLNANPCTPSKRKKRERDRGVIVTVILQGALIGKSEWEWGIRGLWRPIYSIISQLTVSAMAGLPESLLKTWRGLHMTDRFALHWWRGSQENASRGRNGEKEKGSVVRNWRQRAFSPQFDLSFNRTFENSSPYLSCLVWAWSLLLFLYWLYKNTKIVWRN